MTIMKKILALLLSLVFTMLIACSDQQDAHSVNADTTSQPDNAPVITGSNKILEPEGNIKQAVLAELQQGRLELVMFWATYCPICKRDFERLAQFIEDNPTIPLTIIGVVTDGTEFKQKAIRQINERNLNYTHVLTDYENSDQLYQDISQTKLIGVPYQLLYNTKNELVAFSRHAIDLDALEIIVYE